MNRKKAGIWIGVAIAAAALGGAGYYYRNEILDRMPFLQEGKSEDKVYVEKVSRIMNQYTGVSNRYNGVVESQDTYEVNADTSRTIDKIQVEVGELVEEGQTLVSYDTSDLKMQIQQANLEIESINNEIDNYNKQIETLAKERDEAAESEKFSYTTQIQSLENSIAQRKFDLESKQLEISKFQTQIDNSTVKSKVAGVVKEINEKGMDSNGNSAPFMTILQTGEYRIKGNIDEQNVWMLADGQEVLIRSRVDQERTWDGAIQTIDTENPQQGNGNSSSYAMSSDGASESATKYPFYIELADAEGLMLGQHVYIELDEGQEDVKEGLWLYSSYIIQDDGEPYVWMAGEKDRLKKQYIELGDYDEALDEYEIVSGLADEDYITWPMPGLYEGITTVTNESEVDYSSPLYNQEPEDGMDGESVFGTEGMELGTESMELGTEGMESGVENGINETFELDNTDGMQKDADVPEVAR